MSEQNGQTRSPREKRWNNIIVTKGEALTLLNKVAKLMGGPIEAWPSLDEAEPTFGHDPVRVAFEGIGVEVEVRAEAVKFTGPKRKARAKLAGALWGTSVNAPLGEVRLPDKLNAFRMRWDRGDFGLPASWDREEKLKERAL